MTDTPIASKYLQGLATRIAQLFERNADAIAKAVEAIERTAKADGLVYLFGTGHSHILAEEVHYRAGGLALTVPILSTAMMLHEGSVASTAFERLPGAAATVLARYPIAPNDVLIVISNSGVNAAPVEAAKLGKDAGATVIALTSETYSREAAKGRPRIADIADIVLDNSAPSGDAIVDIEGSDLRVGPVTTSIGAALLHAAMAEATARLVKAGGRAPIYLSANMPGAAENNQQLIARYRSRNPHL
ncbi:MAG: SIS domain-containing protein [Rhizobiaceae bacterium]